MPRSITSATSMHASAPIAGTVRSAGSGRGELSPDACSPDVREVLERCDEMRALSHGYFDIRAHRADGRLDPSGFVKGWAVEAAAGILDAAGAQNYCLNAGGDVIARGEPEPGRPWRIGIRHPELPDRVAAAVEARDVAVATSAAYERGGTTSPTLIRNARQPIS